MWSQKPPMGRLKNILAIKLIKVSYFRKADWQAIDSPKKRTDEFDLFAVKSKKANKTNLSVCFLGESMAHQSVFEFN